MSAPGQPEPSSVQIDSKQYWIARDKAGRPLHETVSTGKELKEEWDFRNGSWGMGETVRQTDTGYYFTENIDATKRGLRLSPTINTWSASGSSSIVMPEQAYPPVMFEEQDTAGTRYLFACYNQSANLYSVIKVDISTYSTGSRTDVTITAGTPKPTRAVKFNGFWTLGVDTEVTNAQAFRAMTVVGVGGAVAPTWVNTDTAISVMGTFLLDQTSGTPTIARVVNKAQIEKLATTDTGAPNASGSDDILVDANWTNVGGGNGYVGDATAKALGFASHAGVTLVGKQDNLYAFDKDGNSYAVIPSLNRFIDTINAASGTSSVGSGTLSYGADTFYPHPSGLWLVRQVSEAKNISVDKIPYFTTVPNITPPIRLRYLEGHALGDWVYWIYSLQEQSSTTSWLLAMKFDRHPANQMGVVWHSLLKRSTQMRGMLITSDAKLWWTEPASGANARLRNIQLATDGSPDGTSRGEDSSTYEWYGPEVDFGEPEITKQLRYAFIEVEGGVAGCSWALRGYRDSGTVDSAIGTVTTLSGNANWTVGTADTCRRWRPRFTATTVDITPTSDDPKIIRLIVYARSADVVRMVITPKDRRSQKNLFETTKALRKLKDSGPVTIREPDTNETHSAYIKAVGLIRYEGLSGPEQGIELILERFVTAA